MSDSQDSTTPIEDRSVGMDVYGLTHRGKVREVNEDQFFIASLQKSMRVRQTSVQNLGLFGALRGSCAHLLVVADGLGGHLGGELASGTAVETIATHIAETTGCFYNFDVEKEHEFLSRLEDAIQRSHEQVRARYGSEERGPATTVTMVSVIWPRAYVVQVGDSRAYYLRDGRLRQLTRDQTAYEELLDDGAMTEEQMERSDIAQRLRNVLTSAVGFEIKPSLGLIDLQPGDILLLCTDGLTKHVPDSDITAILQAGGSAEESCRRLVDLTLERGAKDNVTTIVARFALA